LRNCAKTAAKINEQKAMQFDEFRHVHSSYLEFCTFRAQPPTEADTTIRKVLNGVDGGLIEGSNTARTRHTHGNTSHGGTRFLPKMKSILCVVLEWTHDSRRRVGARHIRYSSKWVLRLYGQPRHTVESQSVNTRVAFRPLCSEAYWAAIRALLFGQPPPGIIFSPGRRPPMLVRLQTADHR